MVTSVASCLLGDGQLLVQDVDLLLHRADLPQRLLIRHLLTLSPLPLLQVPEPLPQLLHLQEEEEEEEEEGHQIITTQLVARLHRGVWVGAGRCGSVRCGSVRCG